MMLKPSDAYTAQFTTQHPDTGIATDADSPPTAIVTRNGTDDEAFTLTVSNMTTGRYKIAGTIPSNYAVGDLVQIVVNATLASTAATAIVDQFTIDTKRNSDLIDFDPSSHAVNVGLWAGQTISSTDFTLLSNLDATVSSRSTFNPASDTVIVADITPSGLAEFFTTNSGQTFSTAITGSVIKEIVENITTGSGSTDWSSTEREQIRHRLGIDGATEIPANTGDLSDIKTILQAATRK